MADLGAWAENIITDNSIKTWSCDFYIRCTSCTTGEGSRENRRLKVRRLTLPAGQFSRRCNTEASSNPNRPRIRTQRVRCERGRSNSRLGLPLPTRIAASRKGKILLRLLDHRLVLSRLGFQSWVLWQFEPTFALNVVCAVPQAVCYIVIKTLRQGLFLDAIASPCS